MRDERTHVQVLRVRDLGRDLLVQPRAVLEALQVETQDDRELLHRQLLRRLLVRLAETALDLGSRPEVLRLGEALETVLQGHRTHRVRG